MSDNEEKNEKTEVETTVISDDIEKSPEYTDALHLLRLNQKWDATHLTGFVYKIANCVKLLQK